MRLIRVKGNYNGITLESGKLLFKDMAKAIIDGEEVTLDVRGQKYMTSVFLNASIGYLYAFLKENIIEEKLTIAGDNEAHNSLIVRVREHSRKYWNDDGYKEAVDEVIAKMSEEMDR